MTYTTPWEYRYAHRTSRMGSSVIRELLKFTQQPDIISFAGGLPAPEVFPTEKIQEACNKLLNEQGGLALQYSTTEGHLPLREMIARHNARFSVEVSPENIMITSGSQQGISLASNAFLDPGDYIITEYPTYVGAILSFDFNRAQYAPVEMDHDGMLIDQLEDNVKKYKPKFIYAVSTFQNPTGITMSMDRRKALIEIATKYNVPIIEDNPYKDIRFSGEDVPSLKAS